MYEFPAVLWGKSPSMSIATSSKGVLADTGTKGTLGLGDGGLQTAHCAHF